jgi:uncharacterized membrane protein YfcA
MAFSMSEFLNYALLVGSAFAAGVVNTLAGGGTLLTFPSLMEFGRLSEQMANGTSTVALVPGSLAGAWGFRRELGEASRWLKLLLPPSLVGGLIGTLLVTELPPRYFAVMVPWLILTASLLFLVQPVLARHFPPTAEGLPSGKMQAAVVFFQLLVAIYGGYFGAGIGILMLSSLSFMGIHDILRLNALKTILAAAINGMSVIVFVCRGFVEWRLAWPMVLGAIAGGYLAASIGRRLPKIWVRWFVIAVGLTLSAYYFWRQVTKGG